VYVLRSESDFGFYIGFSTDLKKRLSEHRRGASFATKSRGPWKLIYYEAYTEREDAEGRERFLKSGAGGAFCALNCVIFSNDFPRKRLRLTRSIVASGYHRLEPREAKPFTRLFAEVISRMDERGHVIV